MKKYSKYALLMMVAGLPLAASAEWEVPSQSAAPVADAELIRATAADPTGDTFNPGPDLTGITADTDGTSLTITLDFAGNIEPPPGGGTGIEVVGFIDLDTDQNGATGTAGGNVGTFCPMPPANFGADFSIDVGSFDPMTNTVTVTDSAAMPVGTAAISYTATSLTVVVANATLGGDDGIADINTVIGNQPAPTDCAPDGAVLTSTLGGGTVLPAPAAVPTLNQWGIALLALLAGIGGLVMRRRQTA